MSFDKLKDLNKEDNEILNKLDNLVKKVTKNIENYKLNIALEEIYEFSWHKFADKYIEDTKERARDKNKGTLYTLVHTYFTILSLLHPFAPFVTESIWQELKNLRINPKETLISSTWPKA